ncbi:hypothetical protein [Microcoleus sp. FACHB-1515]|nr:hypothetical protein [Microcoleus sp. FACHB-1515]
MLSRITSVDRVDKPNQIAHAQNGRNDRHNQRKREHYWVAIEHL